MSNAYLYLYPDVTVIYVALLTVLKPLSPLLSFFNTELAALCHTKLVLNVQKTKPWMVANSKHSPNRLIYISEYFNHFAKFMDHCFVLRLYVKATAKKLKM